MTQKEGHVSKEEEAKRTKEKERLAKIEEKERQDGKDSRLFKLVEQKNNIAEGAKSEDPQLSARKEKG